MLDEGRKGGHQKGNGWRNLKRVQKCQKKQVVQNIEGEIVKKIKNMKGIYFRLSESAKSGVYQINIA